MCTNQLECVSPLDLLGLLVACSLTEGRGCSGSQRQGRNGWARVQPSARGHQLPLPPTGLQPHWRQTSFTWTSPGMGHQVSCCEAHAFDVLFNHDFCRLQEKSVKEKQVSHLKAVIALQDKLKGNQHRVKYYFIITDKTFLVAVEYPFYFGYFYRWLTQKKRLKNWASNTKPRARLKETETLLKSLYFDQN